ncbi:hypothetical protein [Dermabacter hominis]
MSSRVLVACASGIVTANVVALRLNREFRERGLDIHAVACDRGRLAAEVGHADALVSVVRDLPRSDIKTFNGDPFLTGVGFKDAFEKLIEYMASLR